MQREEKQLETMMDALIQRIQDLKNSITSFLMKIEREYETMAWPTVLDNFALLSGQLNSLSRLLRSDKIPPLRNYVLLPLVLSPDKDTELEKLTEGRVVMFNHEVVPVYLRTKPEPEMEEKIQELNNKANNTSHDSAQKQLNSLNKITSNILDIINSARDEWESEANQKAAQPQTSSMADTNTLISAITSGKGLKQHRRSEVTQQSNVTSQQQQQQQKPTTTSSSGKTQSTIKTNIKSAHPYQRP